MPIFRRMLFQATLILFFTSGAGLLFNTLRPDGLSLLSAHSSAVDLSSGSGEIAFKDAILLFASGRALFLDARTQWEYDQSHIQGAVSFPPREFEHLLPELRDQLRQAEVLIAYCDGERCPLSHELAAKLMRNGFDNVYVLKNGWALWRNERLPTAPSDLGALFGHTGKICAEDCAE
jgi:rhodanese-related sulfurtransferase